MSVQAVSPRNIQNTSQAKFTKHTNQNITTNQIADNKESQALNALASYNKANVSFGGLKEEQEEALENSYNLANMGIVNKNTAETEREDAQQYLVQSQDVLNLAQDYLSQAAPVLRGNEFMFNLNPGENAFIKYKIDNDSNVEIDKIRIEVNDETAAIIDVNKKGEIDKINVGVKGSIPKDYYAETVYTYKNGQIENIIHELAVSKDRKWAKDVIQYGNDGNLISYLQNYSENKSLGNYSAGSKFNYSDGDLKEVFTNFRYNDDTTDFPYSASKTYIFDKERNPVEILTGIKLFPEYPDNLSTKINI